MKINWKNPYVLGGSILLGLAFLFFAGWGLINLGERNAYQKELDAVNAQLENTSSSGRSSDTHLKLLAKRQALQNLLATT